MRRPLILFIGITGIIGDDCALIQVMTWCRAGEKTLPKPMAKPMETLRYIFFRGYQYAYRHVRIQYGYN